MYSDGVGVTASVAVFITIVTALLIWNVGLSFLIWRQSGFLGHLFPKSGARDIRQKFEEIVASVGKFDESLKGLEKRFGEAQKDSLAHIQKVKLLRYNPYDDVGGDQSFTVALLERQGNGVVITSLHNRSGTRVFAKQVVLGKVGKHEFSKEEAQAIKEALES